jgi:protein gp37
VGESNIEWTDYTHSMWWGCQEILDPDGPGGEDPACHGCYARVRAENSYWWGKRTMFPVWGNDVGRRFFEEKHYLEPLKWNRKAEKAGVPARVFCMSMGDWAEGRPDQKPILDRWLFPIIEDTPWLTWLLLTKRPQLANSLVPERWREEGWPVNAWPGTTAVTQKWWNIRAPHLMKIPACQHFVSVEPQMEAIDIHKPFGGPLPSWIIAGGMSGKIATPMHPDWARSLRDQCVAAGVSFHFKQFGEHNSELIRVGKKKAGRELDGREWNQVPALKDGRWVPGGE